MTDLERLGDKARALGLGSVGNPRLWTDANRAILHLGYAVSKELMDGRPGANPAEGTVWTIAGGLEVLLTVWWVVLKRTPVTSAPVFGALITMQPEDYQRLDAAVIGNEHLVQAHQTAGAFLRDAGL